MQVSASFALAHGGLLTGRSRRDNACTLRSTLADTPSVAVELVRMTDIIFVAVELIGFRVGLDEHSVRQTGLAEHPTVRLTLFVRTDMAARLAGIDTR